MRHIFQSLSAIFILLTLMVTQIGFASSNSLETTDQPLKTAAVTTPPANTDSSRISNMLQLFVKSNNLDADIIYTFQAVLLALQAGLLGWQATINLKQASISRRQMDIASHSFLWQNRPYVAFTEFRSYGPEWSEGWRLTPAWTNHGTTPARPTSAWRAVTKCERETIPAANAHAPGKRQEIRTHDMIGPKEVWETREYTLSAADLEGVIEQRYRLIFDEWLEYQDLFDPPGTYSARFRYLLDCDPNHKAVWSVLGDTEISISRQPPRSKHIRV